jgi:hypothetical protein
VVVTVDGPLAQAGGIAGIFGATGVVITFTLNTAVSELQYGLLGICWNALTMNGGIFPQVTLMQLPVAVVGLPPVTNQLMVLLPVAQYDCVLLAQTVALPVMTGSVGGATTVTNLKAVSLHVAFGLTGTAKTI